MFKFDPLAKIRKWLTASKDVSTEGKWFADAKSIKDLNENKSNKLATKIFTISSSAIGKMNLKSGNLNISWSGYTPIGVVGWAALNDGRLVLGTGHIDSDTTLGYIIINPFNVDLNAGMQITVLYEKNS